MEKKLITLIVVILSAVIVFASCSSSSSEITTFAEKTETTTLLQQDTTALIETDDESTTAAIIETVTSNDVSTVETEPSDTTKVTAEPIEIRLYEITITYVYSDGTEAATTRKALYEAGTVLDVESPEIEGYEANLKRIYWSSISREKLFRVVYSPIETTETE